MEQLLTPKVLRFASASFLTVGIAFMFGATGALYVAQLGSGGGMTLVDIPYQTVEGSRLEAFHGAAYAEPVEGDVALRLTLGILLIVAGFCFHALWLIRYGHLKASRKREPTRAAWIAELKHWMERGMDKHFNN